MAFPLSYNSVGPLPATNSATLAYIEFGPTGAATEPAAGANSFTITEGFINGGIITPTSRTSSNTLANFAQVDVDSVIGRIKVQKP
jgi:hypothetical protein